jgi:putative acetyltransferase
MDQAAMARSDLSLRAYTPADEDVLIELWRRTWQVAYPDIDFVARLHWWRSRWREGIAAGTQVVVADSQAGMVGFVTIDAASGYLDQILVAPEAWGSGVAALLMQEAKRIASSAIHLYVNQDNGRAIGFYQKQGFAVSGEDVNPVSGRPTYLMRWQP